ncbi:hypothetical protein ATCV1_z030L [Acanthocystis turfacea chlorella virus 1]|uniref:Uncharacterized protein z030L n=1 Tax=Chlorovirus heliozoae TaxID=322019 RepID=A7K7Z0_9PHYC|nr:hypothetical protein ATCV1_z030L [Acanthocystis turfacea chlorella virus 1]ABT16164.1 hypothetical protein ATCV1_z030L [Acanthocystis turfacea chlorella virus 1]
MRFRALMTTRTASFKYTPQRGSRTSRTFSSKLSRRLCTRRTMREGMPCSTRWTVRTLISSGGYSRYPRMHCGQRTTTERRLSNMTCSTISTMVSLKRFFHLCVSKMLVYPNSGN